MNLALSVYPKSQAKDHIPLILILQGKVMTIREMLFFIRNKIQSVKLCSHSHSTLTHSKTKAVLLNLRLKTRSSQQ